MHPSPLTALCPALAETRTPVPYPHPGAHSDPQQYPQPYLRSKGRSAHGLALSFTLPGDVRSAFIGRTAIAAALKAHGLSSSIWPTTLAVAELITVTVRNESGQGAVRIAGPPRRRAPSARLGPAPRHLRADVAALCETRRRRALWLLTAVVDDWGGEWGACDATSPQRGTKSLVRLPR
ncbi:hypothetical protein ACIO8F_03505 [Streptomyces sp. NPDC087228]|uniref:hypothetical protein n=1 Tax=Streptomyces sp. NPDC087228 TaxID=3365772 RepID=UPI0038279FD2